MSNFTLAKLSISLLIAATLTSSSAAETPNDLAPLPPELPWDGKSQSLIVSDDDPWITPAEASNFETTPNYEETVAWLRRLVDATPQLKMISIGRSSAGREVWMVIATDDGAETPRLLELSGKPTVLIQAGIHAGEIDGKDAGLMLLRDMTVGKRRRALLLRTNILFIPIFNVDGHERSSPYSRMNQRGPREMGWRTTGLNLNLNRDYSKVDAPEMRAMMTVLKVWKPDLYLDLHVTDGADYQYDITYGYNGRHGYSPAIAKWLDTFLKPTVNRGLKAQGHIPGPLVFLVDGNDPSQGNFGWTAGPRFSNGYGDARHIPTVLVENHSLKPYKQRVLGTYVFLENALNATARNVKSLRQAVRADRARRPAQLPLGFKVPDEVPSKMIFRGVTSRLVESKATGATRAEWLGEPVLLKIPELMATEPTIVVERPEAYWVPGTYSEVIRRLAMHGIEVERQSEPVAVDVELYRFLSPKLERMPFEGRVRVAAETRVERRKQEFLARSVRVPTDQPLGDLAMLLLEPASADSFFQWGFFHNVLQRTEYAEPYVLDPLADHLLESDPRILHQYQRLMQENAEFAKDPARRRRWFYRQTKYWDDQYLLYPIGREMKSAKEAASDGAVGE